MPPSDLKIIIFKNQDQTMYSPFNPSPSHTNILHTKLHQNFKKKLQMDKLKKALYKYVLLFTFSISSRDHKTSKQGSIHRNADNAVTYG